MELSLINFPLNGIDYSHLHMTGEPITQAPSRAATPVQKDEATPPAMQVATMTAGPWGLAQIPKEEPKKVVFWYGGDAPIDEHQEEEFPIHLSTTHQPLHQPGQPRGMGDDPMVVAAMQSAGYLHLEGNLPDHFNGNRTCTCCFLTQFHQFMLMNDGATIAQNDIKKCTYFLSLLEGSKVDRWSEMKYDWLDAIKKDLQQLMGHTP